MTPLPRDVVGRMAPSPTGGLHLGHARTFLIAWLSARSRNGRILLRIEDIDSARLKPGAIESILTDLRWLGLDWDEGPDVGGNHAPYLQSARLGHYDAMLRHLKNRELVYPCTCTRAEIARAASAPHQGEEGPAYPGTCAGRSVADVESLRGRPYAWRFRVPDAEVFWKDGIRGEQTANPSHSVGDFVVSRSTGEPSYQLAVVCDDHLMDVTQVVRGDDLISSTPRQILLHTAMGWTPPSFAHVPLVVDRNGTRLAKRDQSVKLSALRESGIDPRELVSRLASSMGLSDDLGRSWPERWVADFALEALPARAWVAPCLESLQKLRK